MSKVINFGKAIEVFENMHGKVEIEDVFAADISDSRLAFYILTKEVLSVIEDEEIQTTIHINYIDSINCKDNTISLTLTTGEQVEIYSGFPKTAEVVTGQLREHI